MDAVGYALALGTPATAVDAMVAQPELPANTQYQINDKCNAAYDPGTDRFYIWGSNIAFKYDPNTQAPAGLIASPLVANLYFHSVVALGGLIYSFGGFYNASYYNRCEVYDPVSNLWTAKATPGMSVQRAGVCAISATEIYMFGGYNGTSAQSQAKIYNTATNTWSASLSISGTGVKAGFTPQCAYYNGKIYTLDTNSAVMTTTWLQVVDVATWTRSEPMTSGVPIGGQQQNYGAGYEINGQLLFRGGREVIVIDPGGTTYRMISQTSYRTVGPSGAARGNEFWLFGAGSTATHWYKVDKYTVPVPSSARARLLGYLASK